MPYNAKTGIITIPRELREEDMDRIIRSAFGEMTKVPRSLLTTDKPHKIPIVGVEGDHIVFQRRGSGKDFVIVGTIGPFETTVFRRKS